MAGDSAPFVVPRGPKQMKSSELCCHYSNAYYRAGKFIATFRPLNQNALREDIAEQLGFITHRASPLRGA